MQRCFLFVVSLLLLAGSIRAQAPAWQTAVLVGNANNANSSTTVRATAADAAGNVYLVGALRGTVSFSGISLSSAGSSDGYVAKWSRASNTFAWARRLGGTGDDEATALAVSGNSVYVTGYFGLTAAFDGISLTSAGSGDVFVAKLTDAGSSASFAWALRGGGVNLDRTFALAVNGPSVYVAGYFTDNASFGGHVLFSSGGVDVLVAKLTDVGSSASFTWAVRAGGTQSDYVYGLAVNGLNVYVAGNFSGTAGFGTTTLSSTNSVNAFVAKLTDAGSAGSFTWARQAASTSANGANSLAVVGTSLYLSGSFTGTLGLGSAVLTSAGLYDAYLTKLTDAGATGDFVWAQRAGGTGQDEGLGLVASGPVLYWSGYFNAIALFGSTALSAVSSTASDVFVAKLTDAGTSSGFAWAQAAGGAQADYATALALTGTGILYVGGQTQPPAAFGSQSVASPFANSITGFVASLQATPTATASPAALAGLSLLPNPAHGRATVLLPAVGGMATLAILDALGRTIRTQAAATNAPAELDLTGLAPGLYAVRVQAGAATAMRRLVVE